MKLSEWIAENGDKEIEIEGGKITIKESSDHPWMPKSGEHYFYVTVFATIESEFNRETVGDYSRFCLGNCFKTRWRAQKAIDNIDKVKVLEMITGIKENKQ